MARFGTVRKLLMQMPSDELTLNKNRAILRENFLKAGLACFGLHMVGRYKLIFPQYRLTRFITIFPVHPDDHACVCA
ncbi:hypothetical protein HmCmsJML017_04403 [Escherichia coli]|nr:hypothetical protein HmCmsJML017_04403 [Escherichia coli]